MAVALITAHGALPLERAEAHVYAWLEDQGLEVAFGEGNHLIAFSPGEDIPVSVEVDFYALEGGAQTQVRWHVRPNRADPSADDLQALQEWAQSLNSHLESNDLWVVDGQSVAVHDVPIQ
jgi:hypothetical protein